jgi:hypothetical protein
MKDISYVISVSDGAVIGKEIGRESHQIDINCPEAPPFPVELVRIEVSQVLYQKPGFPQPLQTGQLLIFPAALTKHIEQYKLFYQNRVRKSCIYDAYTPSQSSKSANNVYILGNTSYGWCFAVEDSYEILSKKDDVLAIARACFPEHVR